MIHLAFLYRPSTNSSMVFQFPENYEFDFNNQEEQIRANDVILDEFQAQFLPMTYATTDSPEGVEQFRQICMLRYMKN